MVATVLTHPPPRAIKNIATARPGNPDPRSSNFGAELATRAVQPKVYIARLATSVLYWPRRLSIMGAKNIGQVK